MPRRGFQSLRREGASGGDVCGSTCKKMGLRNEEDWDCWDGCCWGGFDAYHHEPIFDEEFTDGDDSGDLDG